MSGMLTTSENSFSVGPFAPFYLPVSDRLHNVRPPRNRFQLKRLMARLALWFKHSRRSYR